MLELFGLPLGTPFQGVSAAVLLAIAGALLRIWIKGIPDRLRVRMELGNATVEAWKALEKRVSEELEDCKRQRLSDAEAQRAEREAHREERVVDARTIQKVKDENFRVKLALDITLDGLLRKDPEDESVKKAKAVMMVAVGPTTMGGGK